MTAKSALVGVAATGIRYHRSGFVKNGPQTGFAGAVNARNLSLNRAAIRCENRCRLTLRQA